jgi:hypothetical protein
MSTNWLTGIPPAGMTESNPTPPKSSVTNV